MTAVNTACAVAAWTKLALKFPDVLGIPIQARHSDIIHSGIADLACKQCGEQELLHSKRHTGTQTYLGREAGTEAGREAGRAKTYTP